MADLFDHQVADIVAVLLRDLGLGVLKGDAGTWPISVNSEAGSPNNVLTVYDTEARPDGRVMQGDVLSHPAIQIRVRAQTQRVAFAKAKAIAYQLDKVVYHNTVVIDANSYCVQSISRSPSLVYIGRAVENSKNEVYTINAYVTTRQIV
jgi:hypothetical protein